MPIFTVQNRLYGISEANVKYYSDRKGHDTSSAQYFSTLPNKILY